MHERKSYTSIDIVEKDAADKIVSSEEKTLYKEVFNDGRELSEKVGLSLPSYSLHAGISEYAAGETFFDRDQDVCYLSLNPNLSEKERSITISHENAHVVQQKHNSYLVELNENLLKQEKITLGFLIEDAKLHVASRVHQEFTAYFRQNQVVPLEKGEVFGHGDLNSLRQGFKDLYQYVNMRTELTRMLLKSQPESEAGDIISHMWIQQDESLGLATKGFIGSGVAYLFRNKDIDLRGLMLCDFTWVRLAEMLEHEDEAGFLTEEQYIQFLYRSITEDKSYKQNLIP